MRDRQVNNQSLLPRLGSLVLRRGTPSPLPHTPDQQDTNPPNTTASRLRAGFSGPARSQSSSCPPPPPPPPRSLPPVPARRRPRPWDLARGAATATPLWRAPSPSSSGAAAPPPPAGSRGGAIPAPSPPPAPRPPPSRTAAPPPRSASKAAEGLGGAAASGPGDRPISGAPGTSSPRPGRGAGCPSLQQRDGGGGGSVGAGRATLRPCRRGPSYWPATLPSPPLPPTPAHRDPDALCHLPAFPISASQWDASP